MSVLHLSAESVFFFFAILGSCSQVLTLPERWMPGESATLNMPANWEKSSGHRTGKGQFSFQSQRKAMPKNAQTSAQLHSSHTLAK